MNSIHPSQDGSNNVKVSGTLVSGGNVDDDISWAPDSSRIAYFADQDSDETDELYTSEPDGSNNVKVSGSMVSGGNVLALTAQWAPDSSRILYIADQDTDGTRELYTSKPDGLNNAKVNGPPRIRKGMSIASFPGLRTVPRIAYVADQDSDETDELYTSEPDGSNNVQGERDPRIRRECR